MTVKTLTVSGLNVAAQVLGGTGLTSSTTNGVTTLSVSGTQSLSSLSIGTIGYTIDDYATGNQIRLYTSTAGKSLWVGAPGGITLNNNTSVTGTFSNGTGTINGLQLTSTVSDNFQLFTYTNTPNPNLTIGYGNGAGAIDQSKEYLSVNNRIYSFMNTSQINMQATRTTAPWVAVQLFAKNTDVLSIGGTISVVGGSGSARTATLTIASTSALHIGMKVTSVATGTTAGAVGTSCIIQSITNSTDIVIFSTTTSTAGTSTYSFADLGGIHWATYVDTLSDQKITGPRQYSIWGYPERTDTGGNANANALNGTLITERFFDLSFPTYNEVYTTGVYQYSTYSMLARFYVPVSINGHLRLRAPQSTSPQGWGGAQTEGRLTIESATTNTASSLGAISGTVMTTSGTVTGAWAAGQVLSGTGVISGTVVTSVSGTGPYTVNLDIDNGTVSSTAMTGTPLTWSIDNSQGLFRIFREDWKTDTTYGGGPNGAVRLAITNAGRVGIGTTAPAGLLHVADATTGGIVVGNNNSSQKGIYFRTTYTVSGATQDYAITARPDILQFFKPASTAASSVRIDYENVGSIDSFNPLWSGVHFGSEALKDTNGSTTTYPRVAMYHNYNTVTAAPNNLTFNITPNNAGSVKYSIKIDTANNGNIVLTPQGTGNVGIGTTDPKSTLHVSGSQSVKVSLALATATTLDATHYIITTPATGNIGYTLPSAATAANRVYMIKRLTTGTVIITPANGDSIETGAANATFSIPAQYDSYTFVSDGTSKWYII